MQEAFTPYDRSDLVFVVLTLDGQEHARAATDLAGVYLALRRQVEMWMKRTRRQLQAMGLDAFGSEWCATVEAHLSDVPHVNLLIACKGWAQWLHERYEAKRMLALGDRLPLREAAGARCVWCRCELGATEAERKRRFCSPVCKREHVEAILLPEPFASHLGPCGLGWRSTAEVPAAKDAVNGYLTKLAAEADQTHGELAKRTQLPLRAPKGFRRLRSGRHFLPPRRKRGDCTGTIVRRVWTEYGDEEVRPLVQSTNHEYMAVVEKVCELEQRLAWDDEGSHRKRRWLRAMGVPAPTRDELTTMHRIELPAPGRGPPRARGVAPAGGASPEASETTRPLS